MREQVERARQIQRERYQGTSTRYNAHMNHRQLRHHAAIDEAAQNILRAAMSDLGLSARAHDKVLRVARTIADLDAAATIAANHLSEAINYRMLDRNLWT